MQVVHPYSGLFATLSCHRIFDSLKGSRGSGNIYQRIVGYAAFIFLIKSQQRALRREESTFLNTKFIPMDNPSCNDIGVSKGSNSYFRVCFVSYIQIVLQSIGYRFAFRVVVIVCSPFRQTDFSYSLLGVIVISLVFIINRKHNFIFINIFNRRVRCCPERGYFFTLHIEDFVSSIAGIEIMLSAIHPL